MKHWKIHHCCWSLWINLSFFLRLTKSETWFIRTQNFHCYWRNTAMYYTIIKWESKSLELFFLFIRLGLYLFVWDYTHRHLLRKIIIMISKIIAYWRIKIIYCLFLLIYLSKRNKEQCLNIMSFLEPILKFLLEELSKTYFCDLNRFLRVTTCFYERIKWLKDFSINLLYFIFLLYCWHA